MGHLKVKLVPGSSRNQIVGWLGDSLKIKVTAPPGKWQATKAVVGLLTSTLGVRSTDIKIESSRPSTSKVVAINGMDDEATKKALIYATPPATPCIAVQRFDSPLVAARCSSLCVSA